jgi:ppGpp synthetase/RelA/SpoT-type nucleotidyltranferase
VDEAAKAHKAVGAAAPLKSPYRARLKVAGKYNGDWSKITDMVRGRILAKDDQQMDGIAADLGNRLGIKSELTYDPETGYRDYKLNPVVAGLKVEIQVRTNAVNQVAEKGHSLYEKKTNIERNANKEGRQLTSRELEEVASLNEQMKYAFQNASGLTVG